jgi:hypothetical protein
MTKKLEALWKTEDWWAVWLGLGIVLLALGVFLTGGSIKAWAVTPGTRSWVADHQSVARGVRGGGAARRTLVGGARARARAVGRPTMATDAACESLAGHQPSLLIPASWRSRGTRASA